MAQSARQVGVVPEEVGLPPAAQELVSRLAALARLTALRAGCLRLQARREVECVTSNNPTFKFPMYTRGPEACTKLMG